MRTRSTWATWGTRRSKYSVKNDGSVDTASAAMFVAQTKSDTVDGMCVDCAGNVYAGTSNGVEIYSPTGTLYRDGSDWRIFELHVRGY